MPSYNISHENKGARAQYNFFLHCSVVDVNIVPFYFMTHCVVTVPSGENGANL